MIGNKVHQIKWSCHIRSQCQICSLLYPVTRPLPNSTSANFFDTHVCACVRVDVCMCVCVYVCVYLSVWSGLIWSGLVWSGLVWSVCLSGAYVCMYVHIHNNIYVYTIYIHMCFTSLFKYIKIYPYTQNVV